MPLATTHEFREDLAKLQVRVLDTLAGYDEILKKSEDDVRPLMVRLYDAHRRHETELSERLRTHGCNPDEDGSFFSTVQRAVIKTRSAFDDLDGDVLNSVIKGEERIMQLYDETISAARDEDDLSLLSRQRGQIANLTNEARQFGY